jgi:hypothetical protein
MYSGIYPPFRHHGGNMYPPYEMMDPYPIPDLNAYPPPPPPPYYDYPYGRNAPCVDYPYYDYAPRVHARPPIVQTNVRNDVCYYMDDYDDEYDDNYGNPYKLSRSRIQLVDLAPRHKPRRNNNRMVVSTFQPKQRQAPERIVIPRSTVVRNTTDPSYERQRRVKLMPLYHSADPQYAVPNRHRSVGRELIPVATVANSRPNRQTIRVRSLSPF